MQDVPANPPAPRPESPRHARAPQANVTGIGSIPLRKVLFLCVHNAARSQIAEAMARSMAPANTEIWSAGSQPTQVHPYVAEVLSEIGVDVSGQRSKHVDEVPWRDVDMVVSVCDEGDAMCPTVDPSVRRMHWPLPDPIASPESERLAAFRRTRDEMRWRISSLWPSGD